MTQFYDRMLAPTGLRATQYPILVRVDAYGPWSIHALAESLVMDRTTLTRTVRPLLRDGLIAVETDARDRRSRVLTITAKGADRLGAAQILWQEAQHRFERMYGNDSAIVLRAALSAVIQTKL